MRRRPEPENGVLEHLLSLRETGQVLGISRAAVYRLIGRGELTLVHLGGRRLVDPGDLRTLIERNKSRLRSENDPAVTGSLVRTSAEGSGGDESG